jgi:hypothetical protein
MSMRARWCAARRTGSRDAGETLVELLITIMIMGISVAAVLGALVMAIGASKLHRNQAEAQDRLRNWAELVSGDTTYGDCPGTTSAFPAAPSMPTGMSATIAGVQYWDGSAFVGGCPVSGDTGVQKVTLRVSVASSIHPAFTQDLDVIVRKPCTASC